ncbi:MAG: PKD domain-containing protein [Flavobacteriales bacterium]|jgi:gliding motility-associated-like protein|nr:PKD domain-containing protein [Flavobacteriales bacterium]
MPILPLNALLQRHLPRFALGLGLLATGYSHGQIYTIADGAITTCTGGLLDSGGQGATGYGDNENFTATICPDTPGQSIHLSFITFDLSAAGAGPLDNLAIYDGPGVASPLLGIWTETGLQGVVVSASPGNASGCLTLVFQSNEVGTGVFAATITCVTPCFPPMAVATVGEPLPALVCPDEVLTFDGSGSFAQPGFNLVQYEWDLGDGTTASTPVVTHSFGTPGAYIAQLTVTDDNGCSNTQTVDLQVFVGTTPVFAGTTESLSVCQGGTVDLYGTASPVTWTALPSVDFGAGVYLPDNVGQTFSSQLTYTSFPPGTTLTSVNDLWSVCVDMEHSFMGDLVISITCPSGQSTVLHQQGGGGTYLGGANDTDNAANPMPGTCWNYCWSPTATLGTFAQSAAFGASPNVMPGGTPTNNALIPGTYSSVQPLNNLVGCPLNGTWTFSVSDLWAIDNGFLCSWNINFNPALYPDLIDFTPVITDGAWTGPGVVPNPNDPFQASITPTVPGTYDYTFTVTDDFGCSYDTAITVTVTNAPEVEAIVTLGSSCSEPATIDASIVAYAPPPPTCNYTLVLNESFGDGWNGGANVQVTINGATTSYTVAPGPNQITVSLLIPVGASISIYYQAGTIWNNENSFELLGYDGTILYDSPQGPATGQLWAGAGNCGPGAGPVTWQWTPATGVDSPNSPNVTAQITQPTTFVVIAHPFGQPWCFGSDTVDVIPPSFLENDSILVHVACNAGTGSIELITTGLGGPWNYLWVDASGATVQATNGSNGDLLTAAAGTYTAFISEGPQGNGCLDTLTATITEPPPLEWGAVPQDTLICLTGTGLISASAFGGTGTINYQWSHGASGAGPHGVSPSDTTEYSVIATDANGCILGPVSATIDVRPAFTLDPLIDDTTCFNVPVLYRATGYSGGDGAYQFDWGSGPQLLDSLWALPPQSTTICVTISDGCETPTVTRCAWLEVLHVPVTELAADTTFGCVPFTVNFALRDTTEGASVLWQFGDGAQLVDDSVVTHSYEDAGNFNVSLFITWPNGCATDTTAYNMIRTLTVPTALLSWSPHPPTINDPRVQFTDQSVPNVVSWWWDFGEFGTSEEQDPVVDFPDDVGGTYPVMLVVANELGCTDTIRTWVDVHDEFMVWVPNTFTPNGVEPNETFWISGNDLSPKDFELLVFDRWGHVVYSTTELDFHWDGTKDGSPLPQGVYPYRLKVHALSTPKKRIIHGHVNLLR